jgi:hypothetical protein
MDEELRLLRNAHEEQSKHILSERLVAADRIRGLELRIVQLEHELERRVQQLQREVTDAHAKLADARREAIDEHERASRHVEAARAERDAAERQLEEFQQTGTYRLVLLMHRVVSRGPARSR